MEAEGRGGRARARALGAGWALAAAGLREPDGDLAAALAEGAFGEEAATLLGALEGESGAPLVAPWGRLAAAHASRTIEDLAEERVRVFGHAVRGPCPPYELEYGNEHFLGKSHRLGDVAAFYEAFGVEVSRAAAERVDHVSVQAEFLSLLALKRSLAEERGEEERAAVCREAEARFLEEHAGRFLPSLERRVAGLAPGSALHAAVALAAGMARVHAAAVGARVGDPDLGLRDLGSVEEETVVSCSPCALPGAGDAGGTEV